MKKPNTKKQVQPEKKLNVVIYCCVGSEGQLK